MLHLIAFALGNSYLAPTKVNGKRAVEWIWSKVEPMYKQAHSTKKS